MGRGQCLKQLDNHFDFLVELSKLLVYIYFHDDPQSVYHAAQALFHYVKWQIRLKRTQLISHAIKYETTRDPVFFVFILWDYPASVITFVSRHSICLIDNQSFYENFGLLWVINGSFVTPASHTVACLSTVEVKGVSIVNRWSELKMPPTRSRRSRGASSAGSSGASAGSPE